MESKYLKLVGKLFYSKSDYSVAIVTRVGDKLQVYVATGDHLADFPKSDVNSNDDLLRYLEVYYVEVCSAYDITKAYYHLAQKKERAYETDA